MIEAKVTWVNGMKLLAESGSGHALVLDALEESGGSGHAPTPMELVLMGLAGCTAMDVVFILRTRMKRALTALTVEVKGERADQPPKIYTDIEILYALTGRDIPVKDALRALTLSSQKYCSVSQMLRKSARMTSRYVLFDEAGQEIARGVLDEEPAQA